MTVTIDWENLGFSYMKLPYRYIAHFKNGQWDQGELTEDANLHISESSQVFTMVNKHLKV